MSETEFPIIAGVVKDETPIAAEGRCQDTQGVRIRNGKLETKKGRQKISSTAFDGIARGAHAWADKQKHPIAGFGTQDKLYTLYGGSITDITPLKAKGTLVDPFTTVNGSSIVEVYDSTHGLNANENIPTYSNADAVGGLTIDGAYTVVEILDINRYTIDAGSAATSSATGGGKVEFSVPLEAGRLHGVAGSGYSGGIYSAGVYGRTTGVNLPSTTWFGANMGSNALFCRADGPTYQFQPRQDYTIDSVTNGDFATDTDWTKGTGWTIGSGVATASAGSQSRLEQDCTGKIDQGDVYELSVTVTRTAGSVEFFIDSKPGATTTEFILGESIEKSATYTRRFRCPPSPIKLGFKKDSSFAGTIDDVSIKVVSEAYRIDSAPPFAGGVTVDKSKAAIWWDTLNQAGEYDPLIVRWSEPGDVETTLSSSDNIAGENADFGNASKVLRVLPADNANIIFTDTSPHLMQPQEGGADAYRFNAINGGAGLKSPHACGADEGRVFWYGRNNKFFIWLGGYSAQSIYCPLEREISDNLKEADADKITCTVDSKYSEVTWRFPDKRDGKEISRSYTYNWVEKEWYNDVEQHTFYIQPGIFEHGIGFGTNSLGYHTDLGDSDNGNPLTTRILTAEYDSADGHNITSLNRFIPDFDDQVGNIEMTIHYRMEARGTAYSQGPFTITPTTKKVDFRVKAKRFWLEFTSNNIETFYRFGALRMNVQTKSATR